MIRPPIRNAVTMAVLVAVLGSAGVLFVQQVVAGASAQPLYIAEQRSSLD